MNVRATCARVLAGVIRQEASLNTLLPAVAGQVSDRDLNLLQEICYGTLRHYPALEAISGKLLAKPLRKKDTDVSALILSGLYQVREMRIPSHAIVNETVSACNALKKGWARGLVNSALRGYLRDRSNIDRDCSDEPCYQTLHPIWLQEILVDAWGDQAGAIMAANNTRPPMTLRVNQTRVSRQDYLALLANRGMPARIATLSEQGIYLESPCNVAELPGFDQGWVSIQDEAAQLSCSLLDLAPDLRVLDSCSAPGGKTCHLLEHETALAELVALDIDDKRLNLVRQNLERLNLSATLKMADATNLQDWWDGRPFDRILLDAPCSATGVIRRHPDIKVLRRAEDIGKLAATQLKLLTALWPTLRPGGKLLYATCSILPSENDEVIEAFCNKQGDCHATEIEADWGSKTRWGRQLLPRPDGHDGFFYALLIKQRADGDATQ